MAHVKRTPLLSDADLRDSLRRVGPLLPVFFVGGRVIDGARRLRICTALGIGVRSRHVSAAQGRHVLWVLHPERALDLYAAGRSLTELADLFGCRPAEVAVYLKRRIKPHTNPSPHHRRARTKLSKVLRHIERAEQGLEPLNAEQLRSVLSGEQS